MLRVETELGIQHVPRDAVICSRTQIYEEDTTKIHPGPSMTENQMKITLSALSFKPSIFHDSATIEEMCRFNAISSATKGSCVVCGKPATKCCVKCKMAPAVLESQYTTTHYCSSDCQKADWVKHKSTCSITFERKILHRAAFTAQQLCLHYLRATYRGGSIEKFEKKSAFEWHLNLKPEREKEIALPEDLISDPIDQEAILTHLACNYVVATMSPILERMLTGIRCKVEEILVEIKDRKLLILLNTSEHPTLFNYRKASHRLFRITLLKSGEEYAVDFTSAQYGHGVFMLPWAQYMQARVKQIVTVWGCGETRKWLKQNISVEEFGIKQFYADFISDYIDLECLTTKMSLPALLRLPETEYEAKRKHFIWKFGAMSMDYTEDMFKRVNSEKSR